MFYANQWWHRLTPTVHHRIELVTTAVLAFAVGLAVSGPGRIAMSSFVDRDAALPAIAAPATNDQSVAGGSSVAAPGTADLQRAMELYREGERALYYGSQRVVPQSGADTELRRALDLYREGERALYYPGRSAVPPSE